MKIPITAQLVILTLSLTGFYMMVGQAVPQKEVQPPEVIEIATDVSTAEMVEIGKGIFEGKGICNTCHTIGKSGALRFPDLAGLAARSATERPGYSALEYLAESLYEPDVYIVDGFSKGMPAISKPPIGLTDQEILTVIAYLQTLGGQATVDMNTKLVYTGGSAPGAGGGEDATSEGAEAAVAEADGASSDQAGDPVLARFGCDSCHSADGADGPVLTDVGQRFDKDKLFLALSRHPSTPDLEQATLADLQTLVEHLSGMRGEG